MRHIFANWRKGIFSFRKPSRLRAGRIAAPIVLLLAAGIAGNARAQQASGVVSDYQAFEARGLLRAATRVDLGTALTARAKQIPFKVGERFNKNDTLIAFDCERYQAQMNAAKASANAAWIGYKSKKRLLKHGAVGKDEVTLAGALANKAAAELSVNEAVSRECTIIAPFSGRIADLNIAPGEYPVPNEPLMSILDDSRLEIELVVPSVWLRWLAPGRDFSFTVEETGETLKSRVGRIGAEVDPVSQTVVIYAEPIDGDGGILAGMSGTARFHGDS